MLEQFIKIQISSLNKEAKKKRNEAKEGKKRNKWMKLEAAEVWHEIKKRPQQIPIVNNSNINEYKYSNVKHWNLIGKIFYDNKTNWRKMGREPTSRVVTTTSSSSNNPCSRSCSIYFGLYIANANVITILHSFFLSPLRLSTHNSRYFLYIEIFHWILRLNIFY